MSYNREELFNLPMEEKLELVEALWERINEDSLGNKMSQKNIEAELDKRIDEITKHPERVISWEEVKAKMKKCD
jgi:putative addiction module component (TIGR02574 family)